MALYLENSDGTRFKVAGSYTNGGGGITEVPVATNTIVGGIKSSDDNGKVKVNPDTAFAEVNNVVTIPGTGNFIVPEEWGEGPWELECTEDKSVDEATGVPSGGTTGQVLKKNSDTDYDTGWESLSANIISYDNENSQLEATDVQSAIDEIDAQTKTNTQDITENAANIALHHTEIIKNADDIATLNTSVANVQSDLTYYSNRNLLDNWYFRNPVNQQNLTLYTDTGYCIDRWFKYNATNYTANFTVNNGYCSFYGGELHHRMDLPYNNLAGKDITISLLTNEKEMYYATGTVPLIFPSNFYTVCTGIMPNNMKIAFDIWSSSTATSTVIFWFSIINPTNIPLNIIAVKLELGAKQTLAHQDSDGSWSISDPPPNFQQELTKCQRYFQIFGNIASVSGEYTDIGSGFSYTLPATSPLKSEISLQIPLCVPLRARPSVTINKQLRILVPTSVGSVITYMPDVGSYAIQFIEGFSNIANIGIRVPTEQLPASSYLQVDNNGNIENWISLNANL